MRASAHSQYISGISGDNYVYELETIHGHPWVSYIYLDIVQFKEKKDDKIESDMVH